MAGSIFYGCIFGFLVFVNVALAIGVIITKGKYSQCVANFSSLCPLIMCSENVCPKVVCPENMDCSFMYCAGKQMLTVKAQSTE